MPKTEEEEYSKRKKRIPKIIIIKKIKLPVYMKFTVHDTLILRISRFYQNFEMKMSRKIGAAKTCLPENKVILYKKKKVESNHYLSVATFVELDFQ